MPHSSKPPLDMKGKVERTIQNLNMEFVYQLRKFLAWLSRRLKEFRHWFNHERFHRGVNAMPEELYECNVGNLT